MTRSWRSVMSSVASRPLCPSSPRHGDLRPWAGAVRDHRLRLEGGGTMFEKIVLAVDGSEPAQRAVPVAADIASKYGSEVVAVHVVEQQLGRGGPIAYDTTEEATRDADDAARSLKDLGVSARAEARAALAGRAAQEIMDVA